MPPRRGRECGNSWPAAGRAKRKPSIMSAALSAAGHVLPAAVAERSPAQPVHRVFADLFHSGRRLDRAAPAATTRSRTSCARPARLGSFILAAPAVHEDVPVQAPHDLVKSHRPPPLGVKARARHRSSRRTVRSQYSADLTGPWRDVVEHVVGTSRRCGSGCLRPCRCPARCTLLEALQSSPTGAVVPMARCVEPSRISVEFYCTISLYGDSFGVGDRASPYSVGPPVGSSICPQQRWHHPPLIEVRS